MEMTDTCRVWKCNQTYHQSHFSVAMVPVMICGRCAVETGLVTVDEAPQFYSDELARPTSPVQQEVPSTCIH